MRLLVVVILGFLALGHGVRAVDVIFGYEDPSQNKFKNWDFESNLSNNDWTVSGATVTKVSGGHTGHSSVKIESRYFYIILSFLNICCLFSTLCVVQFVYTQSTGVSFAKH